MEKEETFQAQLARFAFDPARDRIAKLEDHSNDPYFVKKLNKAIETLTRVGFPAELLKLKDERFKE